MSANPSRDSEEVIPLGVVFSAVGLIILVTVGAIWLITPAKMPQPLYNIVGPYLPRTAVVPTPAAVAGMPPEAETVLLPETLQQVNPEALPPYFVSAEAAQKSDPFAGEPTRLVIPALDIDAPIGQVGLQLIEDDDQTYHQWQVPNEYRVGWHDSSALLGQPGNTVLNGHHNIHGEVFRDLVDLKKGDEIILYDIRRSYIYQVTEVKVLLERGQPLSVRRKNARWMLPTEDERITLVSCWPYTDNSHRVVVIATPAPGAEAPGT